MKRASITLEMADGKRPTVQVSADPDSIAVTGPWQVQFDPRWRGPQQVVFDELVDWTKRPEDGIRYYSGTATYRSTFILPASAKPGQRLWLDLGASAIWPPFGSMARHLGHTLDDAVAESISPRSPEQVTTSWKSTSSILGTIGSWVICGCPSPSGVPIWRCRSCRPTRNWCPPDCSVPYGSNRRSNWR